MIFFCRSVITCLLSHTEVKVWNSGFQNRSSRRNPAFCSNNQDIKNLPYNYAFSTRSCGYDKVRPSIFQCAYDIEYCWRYTDITGPSQASSIHLLTKAVRYGLDSAFGPRLQSSSSMPCSNVPPFRRYIRTPQNITEGCTSSEAQRGIDRMIKKLASDTLRWRANRINGFTQYQVPLRFLCAYLVKPNAVSIV